VPTTVETGAETITLEKKLRQERIMPNRPFLGMDANCETGTTDPLSDFIVPFLMVSI